MSNRRTLPWFVAACLALIATGCGDDGDRKAAETNDDAATVTTTIDDAVMDKDDDAAADDARMPDKQLPLTKPRPNLVVTAARSQFGSVLFDGDGQVFYLFDSDTGSTSTCYDDCAEAWPPVLVDGDPTAGKGADPRKLGTTRRKDGATQLTYAGKPMYYYAHEKPGEVKCHNIETHGGLWLVVRPDGSPAPV